MNMELNEKELSSIWIGLYLYRKHHSDDLDTNQKKALTRLLNKMEKSIGEERRLKAYGI